VNAAAFINPDILEGRRAPCRESPIRESPIQDSSQPNWDARIARCPSAHHNIVKPSNWQQYAFPFIYGQFDPMLFPTNDWCECCMKALSVIEIRDWAPDLIARDDETLVQQIRTRACCRGAARGRPWVRAFAALLRPGRRPRAGVARCTGWTNKPPRGVSTHRSRRAWCSAQPPPECDASQRWRSAGVGRISSRPTGSLRCARSADCSLRPSRPWVCR